MRVSRRALVALLGAATLLPSRGRPEAAALDVTFLFTNDTIPATWGGPQPKCAQEGKTDGNLLRHIAGIIASRVHLAAGDSRNAKRTRWCRRAIAVPRGVVVGGDMTDDGGGQVAQPAKAPNCCSSAGDTSRVRGRPYPRPGLYRARQSRPRSGRSSAGHRWYRREFRDYVELNHLTSVFSKPPVPVTNMMSSPTTIPGTGAACISCRSIAMRATREGRHRQPAVVETGPRRVRRRRQAGDLFQHYGWDAFSRERWDPWQADVRRTGAALRTGGATRSVTHWCAAIDAYNVVAMFHGHQHESAIVYRAKRSIFQAKGGLHRRVRVARVTEAVGCGA